MIACRNARPCRHHERPVHGSVRRSRRRSVGGGELPRGSRNAVGDRVHVPRLDVLVARYEQRVAASGGEQSVVAAGLRDVASSAAAAAPSGRAALLPMADRTRSHRRRAALQRSRPPPPAPRAPPRHPRRGNRRDDHVRTAPAVAISLPFHPGAGGAGEGGTVACGLDFRFSPLGPTVSCTASSAWRAVPSESWPVCSVTRR